MKWQCFIFLVFWPKATFGNLLKYGLNHDSEGTIECWYRGIYHFNFHIPLAPITQKTLFLGKILKAVFSKPIFHCFPKNSGIWDFFLKKITDQWVLSFFYFWPIVVDINILKPKKPLAQHAVRNHHFLLTFNKRGV